MSNMVRPSVIVKELMDRRPEVIPVFIRHRMACPGCAMAQFETLQEIAAIYKMPLDPFLKELREAEGSSLTS